MDTIIRRSIFLISVLFITAVSCASPPVADITQDNLQLDLETATEVRPLLPTETPIPPTAAPPLESLLVPVYEVGEPEVIYTKAQRDARDLFFWPDGNFGVVRVGDQFRFFAANSFDIAHTVGDLSNPAAIVQDSDLRVERTDEEFAYMAGGPIYVDPASGQWLMFYHAERHFGGPAAYVELGMARSTDEGRTFQDLGIIITPNLPFRTDRIASFDIGGAPYVILDDYVYVYFTDKLENGNDIFFAVARASLEDVVAAALKGTMTDWQKYYEGSFSEPGIGGRSSPLETGNPLNRWMSVSYNTSLNRLLAVLVDRDDDSSTIHMIVSEDGINWSQRVTLHTRQGELMYPSIISPDNDSPLTSESFYVYYTSSDRMADRWQDASLERFEVRLTGEMGEKPSEWDFEVDAGGWASLNDVGSFEILDGFLVIEPTGVDPYIQSETLGLSTEVYTRIEVRMRSELSGIGQFFFTGSEVAGFSEENSLRFDVIPGEEFQTYSLDMSSIPGWVGHLGFLRFDPITAQGRVEIDYIRLLP